ncbi:hypothetical protein [Streptomyces sp. NPDC002587]
MADGAAHELADHRQHVEQDGLDGAAPWAGSQEELREPSVAS